MSVGVTKDYKLKVRNLHASNTLGWSRIKLRVNETTPVFGENGRSGPGGTGPGGLTCGFVYYESLILAKFCGDVNYQKVKFHRFARIIHTEM